MAGLGNIFKTHIRKRVRETREEKAVRIRALKDAEEAYLPVVYAIIAAAVGGIVLYFSYLDA